MRNPKCCVCNNTRQAAFLHYFPVNDKRYQWLDCVNVEFLRQLSNKQLAKQSVCHLHFEKRFTKSNDRLRYGAYPTLFTSEEISSGVPRRKFPDLSAAYRHVSKGHTDHNYSAELRAAAKTVQQLERIPQGAPVRVPTKDAVQLPTNGAVQLPQDSARSPEADDHVEADTFDNDDSPPSPEPDIAAAVQEQKPKEEMVFSWQKAELIETDDTEDSTPEPVSDDPTLRDDAVTLSSFCEEPEPPSVPCEPAVAPVPEVVENLCQVCGAVEDGYYFWCVSCGAGALCGACAATLAHELHFVLRAPTAASKEQTQTIVAVLRQQLENENLLRMFETGENGMKVELKQELEELPILHSPEPEPDPLCRLDPLAGLSDPFVNPDTEEQGQIEVTVTDGLTESLDTDRAVSETMTTDVDVEFVRETIDHHQFKRPRLMDHRQNIKPATKNLQLPLLKHLNLKGSQSIISNPAGSKTVLQAFQSKRDIIKNLQAKGFQPIKPKITRADQFKASLEEYRKMLKNRRQNPESCTIQNTSKVPNIVVAPILTEKTTVDLEEIQFLVEKTINQTVENESNIDLRKNQNNTNDISDTESVLFTDDDTDKEYRIDEDDISDDSMDWDGINISERGVGRRTRNDTKSVVKGPCEAMLRSLPSEATVTLQPLTSSEISKWMTDRERRRED